jgi:hypothetical protein
VAPIAGISVPKICGSRAADASITIEPELFYALATGRATPQAAGPRVEIEGDPQIAAAVLDAVSGSVPSR